MGVTETKQHLHVFAEFGTLVVPKVSHIVFKGGYLNQVIE